ncbi:Hypermethylated in cancer 2 protein [Eumeta japonica]|uniref:Hypermethylated in cancer 2 protein n=1 Tax=Eumeta variegata TaxID=151549 RepID=A0A4C1ZA21_EUMVA|nr:Hypermethylated in cancer 2 protein [Eumeta japonica]
MCLGRCKNYQNCSAIGIKPDDGLPQNICEQCFEIVNSIRVLRELALCNESRLKVFMLNNNTKGIDSNVTDKNVASTDSVTITQIYKEDLLNNINLSKQIRNSGDRGQQTEDDNQFMNLEIIEDGVKLEDDDYIQIDDNYLSINDSAHLELPASSRLAVRKDLFSTDVVANEPQSPNETTQNSICNKFDDTVTTSEQGHVKAEIDQVHKCSICDKVYQSKKKWYHHQRTHNKPFSCPVPLCNKKFANRGDVDKHVRVHTGEKPYECEICFKKFTQRHNPTKCSPRLRERQAERPYAVQRARARDELEFCAYALYRMRNLPQHLPHTQLLDVTYLLVDVELISFTVTVAAANINTGHTRDCFAPSEPVAHVDN